MVVHVGSLQIIDGSFLSLFSSIIFVVIIIFVNQMFCLTLCIFSIVIWIDLDRCLQTLSAVSLGNDVNQLLLIAHVSVITIGAPS